MIKVVAIGGSPRFHSNTGQLIDVVFSEIQRRGIETEKIILSRHRISPCFGHDDCAQQAECRIRDDAPAILEKFREADGVILASPVYMCTISAFMKLFMDRTYFTYTHNLPLKARAAALIAIGGGNGADETIQEMGKLLGPSKLQPLIVKGYTGPEDDIRKCPAVLQSAAAAGRQMADILLKSQA